MAACYPGAHWYYMDIQGFNTTGPRSENYELRITKTLIESDGDNHPTTATPVTYEMGKTTVRETGSVIRGPDMFDWYKVYLNAGRGGERQPDPYREGYRHIQIVDIQGQHHFVIPK